MVPFLLQVRHILCVKPNDQLSSSFLDGTTFLRQLSTAGIVVATEREIAALPHGRRVDKDAFFKDFRVVPGATQRRVFTLFRFVLELVLNFGVSSSPAGSNDYGLGGTRIKCASISFPAVGGLQTSCLHPLRLKN